MRCTLQLCIHRTRIAQQRKTIGTGMSLTKTIKRQAFNKDRKLRLTATTKPNGRKSTSVIDFSLPPRTPPRSSSAAKADAAAVAAAVNGPDVVRVGGLVVALSSDAGIEQGAASDSASDVSQGDGSVHSDEDKFSGEESEEGERHHGGKSPVEPRGNDGAIPHELNSHDSPPNTATSSSAAAECAPSHSAAAAGSAAGEGWDSLAPFGDVDAAAAAAKDGGGGEGRIALLPVDGLLFHDVPMFEPPLCTAISRFARRAVRILITLKC